WKRCGVNCFRFFFSSRRRHTRFSRDWSSDVCSSDLPSKIPRVSFVLALFVGDARPMDVASDRYGSLVHGFETSAKRGGQRRYLRSEERRVGKECRTWRSTDQQQEETEHTRKI